MTGWGDVPLNLRLERSTVMLWTFQNRIASIGLKVQVDVMVNAQGEVGVSADVEMDVGVNVSCHWNVK